MAEVCALHRLNTSFHWRARDACIGTLTAASASGKASERVKSMKRAIVTLVALVTLGVLPLAAQDPSSPSFRENIVTAGPRGDAGGTGIQTLSEGWSMDQAYRNVSISASLSNGGGSARGIAYLMRSIGPGTTCASEIANVRFDLPVGYDGMYTLFTGLDLSPGEYWLVFSKPRVGPFSYASWTTSSRQAVTVGAQVRFLGMAWVVGEDGEGIAEYMPASGFNVYADQVAYQFEVTGEPVSSKFRRAPTTGHP